jgi:hypothetical protein
MRKYLIFMNNNKLRDPYLAAFLVLILGRVIVDCIAKCISSHLPSPLHPLPLDIEL